MDLIDRLRDLSVRLPKLEEGGLVTTEEGTKNALVMPFIQALGYDVFNPLEVTPELTADVGTKKGEKVDYAILRDGKPIILFECKGFASELSLKHVSQLYRYFSVTEARFGVLTNGIQYQFFSDLDSPNKMDDRPFLIFDLADISDHAVETLKQFAKSAFDQDEIINRASELKYRNAIKQFISTQYSEPSEEFVKLCLRDAYAGRFTQTVVDSFTPITRSAFRSFINDQVEKRLKSALASESQTDTDEVPAVADEVVVVTEPDDTDKIVTTQEELDAYFAVKSIVREVIDVKRVTLRDAQSYCSVLIDDNNRKNLCRFRFNYTSKRYVGIMDEDKHEETYEIEGIDDIYQYADKLRERARFFVED